MYAHEIADLGSGFQKCGWHHQAVYGRVEGLYTRAELVRSLAELQAHARRLETRGEFYGVTCEEAFKQLEDERDWGLVAQLPA